MKKRILAALLALVVCTMAGCSAGGKKETITLAMGNGYKPFCYLDENEKPAGYEKELFDMVAEKMSDKYEVEYVCDSWNNLFVGLESGKYDIISHHMAYNAERAEKYNVSSESLMYYGNYRAIYKAGRTDISDFESMKGMTLANSEVDNIGKAVLEFNAENPDNPIILQETQGSMEGIIAGIQSGLYDAYLHTGFDLQTKYLDNYPDAGLEMSSVDLVDDMDCGTYVLFKKGNDTLQADFDAAIKELRAEGKIKELSMKWFGQDYSVEPK